MAGTALARAVLGQAILDLTRHGHAADAVAWLSGGEAVVTFAWVRTVLALSADTGARLVALAPDLTHCAGCGASPLPSPWHRYCVACPTPKRGRSAATHVPVRRVADRASTLRALALDLLAAAALRRLPSGR